jgi:hypothetical protein
MEKFYEFPKGTKVVTRLTMSPQITNTVEAVIKKYGRVYGTQTVIDERDPSKMKFFPVWLVEVEVQSPDKWVARIDVRCIQTRPEEVLKKVVEGK